MRALLLAALVAFSGAATAGTYLEMTDRDLAAPAGKPDVQKMWFDAGRFRIDDLDGDSRHTAIFRDQKLFTVDHENRTYTAIDKASLQQLGGQFAEMRRQMEEHMAHLPPEQRAQMEQMMKGRGAPATAAPKRTVRATGRTENVAGRSCKVWEIHSGSAKEQELCVVAPGSLPGGADMMKAMREMGAMFRDFAQSIGGSMQDVAGDAWSDLEKIDGIPILTREFESGKAVAETRLAAVREEAVPAATFEMPKGFREQKLDLGERE